MMIVLFALYYNLHFMGRLVGIPIRRRLYKLSLSLSLCYPQINKMTVAMRVDHVSAMMLCLFNIIM